MAVLDVAALGLGRIDEKNALSSGVRSAAVYRSNGARPRRCVDARAELDGVEVKLEDPPLGSTCSIPDQKQLCSLRDRVFS